MKNIIKDKDEKVDYQESNLYFKFNQRNISIDDVINPPEVSEREKEATLDALDKDIVERIEKSNSDIEASHLCKFFIIFRVNMGKNRFLDVKLSVETA